MRIGRALGAASWLVVEVAVADPVAVLEPEIEPASALESEAIGKLHDSLISGLETGGLSGPRRAEVIGKQARTKIGNCSRATCAGSAASTLGVARVVVTSIQVTGKNYDVQCQLVGADGSTQAKAAGSCDICTFTEAQEAVGRVATDLAKRAPPPSAPPTVAPMATAKEAKPSPPAAKPTQKKSPPPMAPRAPLPVVSPEPTDTGTGVAVEPPRERPYLWWAAGSWAVGVVGLAVGGYFVSLHGDPACVCEGADCPPDFDSEQDCEEVFNTGALGASLMGVGAAAVTGGFLLFFRERPMGAEGAVGVGITPGPRGGAAAGWWRF